MRILSMKISKIIDKKKLLISFEIFPPKQEANFDSVMQAALDLGGLNPDFISVTYGAGGTTRSYTAELASSLQEKTQIPSLAHLTCVGSGFSDIQSIIRELKEKKIENVLALRGDYPQGADASDLPGDCAYASDLVRILKKEADFCIGGACYPEGHPESENRLEDLQHLQYKVDAGLDFLTTQMFFDNEVLYSFLYRMQSKGMKLPVFAGIMPVTNAKQIKRMITLSNAHMPQKLLAFVDRFQDNPGAMMQAGIAYATEQIIDLIANGIRGVHIYSMNKPDITAAIMHNISHIVEAVNAEAHV